MAGLNKKGISGAFRSLPDAIESIMLHTFAIQGVLDKFPDPRTGAL
jgi:hypothetical protein